MSEDPLDLLTEMLADARVRLVYELEGSETSARNLYEALGSVDRAMEQARRLKEERRRREEESR